MAEVGALQRGLAANIETVSEMRALDTVPDNVTPPVTVVAKRTPQFAVQETMDGLGAVRGLFRYPYQLFVIAARASVEKAQERLDELISVEGSRSLYLALYSDRTLGGVADNVLWEGVSDYNLATIIGNTPYAVATIDITVRAR